MLLVPQTAASAWGVFFVVVLWSACSFLSFWCYSVCMFMFVCGGIVYLVLCFDLQLSALRNPPGGHHLFFSFFLSTYFYLALQKFLSFIECTCRACGIQYDRWHGIASSNLLTAQQCARYGQ